MRKRKEAGKKTEIGIKKKQNKVGENTICARLQYDWYVRKGKQLLIKYLNSASCEPRKKKYKKKNNGKTSENTDKKNHKFISNVFPLVSYIICFVNYGTYVY